jgi:hypothetical protein
MARKGAKAEVQEAPVEAPAEPGPSALQMEIVPGDSLAVMRVKWDTMSTGEREAAMPRLMRSGRIRQFLRSVGVRA